MPSDSNIGNIVGQWIGSLYKWEVGHGHFDNYLLIDRRLFYRGEELKADDLSVRSSRYGKPRPGIDPDVFTALQTTEFFNFERPDILDADRGDLYEIKPVRGAAAGAPQLDGYLDRLNAFATNPPPDLPNRARQWQAGEWELRREIEIDTEGKSLFICVYPEKKGVLLYDIRWCPRRKRREDDDQHQWHPIWIQPDDSGGDWAGKGRGEGKGDLDEPQPQDPIQVGDLAALAAAVIAAGTALAEIPLMAALEAVGAALGWALARLLTGLSIFLAATSDAGADTRDDAAPEVGGPPRGKIPVPGDQKPVTPASHPAAGAHPATRARPAAKVAAPPGKVTEWATIERLMPDQAWIGQELLVWNNQQGKQAHVWAVRVTEKVTEGKTTTLTLVSFEEADARGALPAGNVYKVTYPYSPAPGHETERGNSVALVVAERHHAPREGTAGGGGLLATILEGLRRAAARPAPSAR